MEIEEISIPEIVVKEKDKKCAPGKKFEDGSCITLETLIEIANAHNKENELNKIKLYPGYEILNRKKYKKYLLHKLSKIYPKGQQSWLDQQFVNLMKNQEKNDLLKYSFRPDGPDGKFEWLNTIHINETMEQYEKVYPDFKFLGAVPIDFADLPALNIPDTNNDFEELEKKGIHRIGIIFNLDEHWKSGSHWVMSFIDLKNGYIYYADSYGIIADKRIRHFMRHAAVYYMHKNNKKPEVKYNKIRHQYGDSECGVYSISYILRLLKGESFDEITQNKVSDEKINQCRKVYFS